MYMWHILTWSIGSSEYCCWGWTININIIRKCSRDESQYQRSFNCGILKTNIHTTCLASTFISFISFSRKSKCDIWRNSCAWKLIAFTCACMKSTSMKTTTYYWHALYLLVISRIRMLDTFWMKIFPAVVKVDSCSCDSWSSITSSSVPSKATPLSCGKSIATCAVSFCCSRAVDLQALVL